MFAVVSPAHRHIAPAQLTTPRRSSLHQKLPSKIQETLKGQEPMGLEAAQKAHWYYHGTYLGTAVVNDIQGVF